VVAAVSTAVDAASRVRSKPALAVVRTVPAVREPRLNAARAGVKVNARTVSTAVVASGVSAEPPRWVISLLIPPTPLLN